MSEKIQVKNLSFSYPSGVEALRDIDLSINHLETVCIIGQNGSGKTTLVRQFNGLLKPTKGEVFVNGANTRDLTVGELSKTVGYVFQNPNHQIFCKTVMEELEVGPNNLGISPELKKKNIDTAIELLQLESVLEKHPLTLDYTSKKILTIASVLTFAPQIFIMDEPTGGLDEEGRELLRKTMKILKQNGHTIVMISHDMDFIAETMDKVVIMAEGRILKECKMEKAFEDELVLKKAWLEPPQITKLAYELRGSKETVLTVKEFINKY